MFNKQVIFKTFSREYLDLSILLDCAMKTTLFSKLVTLTGRLPG